MSGHNWACQTLSPKPIILNIPFFQLPGLDIRLTVRVDGVPKPELSWYKDGKPIEIDVSQNELEI